MVQLHSNFTATRCEEKDGQTVVIAGPRQDRDNCDKPHGIESNIVLCLILRYDDILQISTKNSLTEGW